MSTPPLTLDELRALDLFDGLTDDELGEWLAVSRVRDVAPGEKLADTTGVPTGVTFLLTGSARAYLVDGDRADPVSTHEAPTWIGAIAVLTDQPYGVRMTAETGMRVATVTGADFRRLAFAHPPVHSKVINAIAPVVSRLTAMEQDRERLASLGTMAAGLAHELNNPAAAAQSAATQLGEALGSVSAALSRFVHAGVERDAAKGLVELHDQAIAVAEGRSALDALDAADAEDDVLDLLEARGVAEAWRHAEPLARAGVDAAWLDRAAALAGPALDAAVAWVAAAITSRALVSEVRESVGRVSELVGAVKSYAYLDHGETVEVDLNEGLETTLVVLGHKLRHAGITVVRDYDRELPPVSGSGSELNQVWTNLIANAIDALAEARPDGGGTITVRTCRDEGCAVVEIEDDGPGIPADVRDRIFDAFFTTKEVGRGTGLGLSTAWRIVAERHAGSLSVDTEPGRTVFHVRLPVGGR